MVDVPVVRHVALLEVDVYFFSIAGIRLPSRACSNLANPATFSGGNWLPDGVSSRTRIDVITTSDWI